MSLLRSVIADARPRKPVIEPLDSPPAITVRKTRGLDGDALGSKTIADPREGIITATNRSSLIDERSRSQLPVENISNKEPVESVDAHHGEVKDTVTKAQSVKDIVSDTISVTIDDTDTSNALSVNCPNVGGGKQQGHEITLPLNEITLHNDDSMPEMDSKNEESLHISDKHGQDRERSDRETDNSGEVFTSKQSEVALPQPEKDVGLIVEKEKFEFANTNRESSSDMLSENASNAVISPIAIGEQDRKEWQENDAKLSGKVSVKAEFSKQSDFTKTNVNKQNSEQMSADRYSPLQKSTDASQVLTNVATKALSLQDKAVTGDLMDRNETTTLQNTVNVVLPDNSEPGPLPKLSAAKKGKEKTLTRVAAQAQPAAVQARVLHNNPVSHNSISHSAKTAYGTSVGSPKAPEVKIGQVDVFIEAPKRTGSRGILAPRPSLSLSSRHYLRRL